MVSQEVLKKYAFFRELDEATLQVISQEAEEISFAKGDTIYETGQKNDSLIFLEDGCVESFLIVDDPVNFSNRQEVYLFDLDLRQIFGLSSLVERQNHTTTARAGAPGKLIRISAEALLDYCDQNPCVGYALMREIVATLSRRLEGGFFCNRCPRAIADQVEAVRRGTVTGGRVLA